MNAVSNMIKPLYLAAYLVFVALAFGWLPSLSEGPQSGLLYGHLAEPHFAASMAHVGALYAAAAMYYAGPKTSRGMLVLLVACAALLNVIGPLMGSFSQFNALLWASVLVAPLIGMRARSPEKSKGLRLEYLGIALGTAAVTVALLALTSRLSLFGYQEPAERHLEAMVFLALATLGGFAFGLPIAAKRLSATLPAALCALGALIGLVLLVPLESSRGLESFLRHYNADLSEVGRIKGTLLIAGRALLIPGFTFGILAACLQTRASQAACFFGIGFGFFAWPFLPEPSELIPLSQSAIRFSIYVALAAALLPALAALPSEKGPRRFAALIILPLIAGATFKLPGTDVTPTAPWLRFEAETLFQVDDPLGLIAVETTPSGLPVLSIDRIRLTPPTEQVSADLARLTASLQLLESNWKSDDPNPTILLAGQLTVERLLAFTDWNDASGLNASLSWTTPWDRHQGQIRPLLESTWELPDPTPFHEAQAKVGSGELDLVIVPMAFGQRATTMTAVAPPRASAPFANPNWSQDQPAVVWLPGDAPIAGANLGGSVLIAGSDLDHLGIGIVHLFDNESSALHPSGTPQSTPSAIRRPSQRLPKRNLLDQAALFNRLASSSATDAPDLLTPLATFFNSQVINSPWVKEDMRFEIDSELLTGLAEAIDGPPTVFEALIWNHLATNLVAMRGEALGDLYRLIPGILERTGSWPELEYALAHSYLEFMMPEEAAELLTPLFEQQFLGLVPLVHYGTCLGQLDQWESAALAFEAAQTMAPGSHSIERKLAIASLRAGRPTGEAMIRALLVEHPEDLELENYLLPGALPPINEGFDPTPLGADQHVD